MRQFYLFLGNDGNTYPFRTLWVSSQYSSLRLIYSQRERGLALRWNLLAPPFNVMKELKIKRIL